MSYFEYCCFIFAIAVQKKSGNEFVNIGVT